MKKKNKFVHDKLSIAQVHKNSLSIDLLNELREIASFKDTDKKFNEFIVSVDAINTMINDWKLQKDYTSDAITKEASSLLRELKKQKFNYVHITTI